MAYRLIVTHSAEADLADIVAYLVEELRNPDAAVRLLDEVARRYDALEENPYLYARCAHPILTPGGYRKAAVGGYLLVFHIDEPEKSVYIDRVFHELQDYADKL